RVHSRPGGAFRLDGRGPAGRPLAHAARGERARVRGRLHPRLEEKELPIRQAKKPVEIAEERRLLYVGITRAKRQLALTWSGRPSRFLRELGVETRAARAHEPGDPLYAALKQWRYERATADAQPAYVVFHNTTLAEIASRRPRDLGELGAVPGVGPTKLERYGPEVLAVLDAA